MSTRAERLEAHHILQCGRCLRYYWAGKWMNSRWIAHMIEKWGAIVDIVVCDWCG